MRRIEPERHLPPTSRALSLLGQIQNPPGDGAPVQPLLGLQHPDGLFFVQARDGQVPVGDAPVQAPVPLTGVRLRLFQQDLLNLATRLPTGEIISILPEADRDAQRIVVRNRVRGEVDAAVNRILAALANGAAPNIESIFPGGPGQERPEFITNAVIIRIRNLRNAGRDDAAVRNAVRDELAEPETDRLLPQLLRDHVLERMRAEMNAGNFQQFSRALYERVATWLDSQVMASLQNLAGRWMTLDPGCPLEPPRSPLGVGPNRPHVAHDDFMSMIRAFREGRQDNEVNFRLPRIGDGAAPNLDHAVHLLNAYNWYRDTDRLVLAPIAMENRRAALGLVLEQFNRLAWARPQNETNPEGWRARATVYSDLENQMYRTAQALLDLNRRFPNVSIAGLQPGNFPGPAFRIENNRIVRESFRPNLPGALTNDWDHTQALQPCLTWLRQQMDVYNQAVGELLAGRESADNVFMLGDSERPTLAEINTTVRRSVAHIVGELNRNQNASADSMFSGDMLPLADVVERIRVLRRGGQLEVTDARIQEIINEEIHRLSHAPNGRSYNLITHDYEIGTADPRTGLIPVTPITRYRDVPFWNYQNLGQFEVDTVRGRTRNLRPDQLVLIFQDGRPDLELVSNLAGRQRSHFWWWLGGVSLGIAIDLSMIVSGGVAVATARGAARVAATRLAARLGEDVARQMAVREFRRQILSGSYHLLLGGSGILTSSYFGESDVGRTARLIRHGLFVFDAARGTAALVGRLRGASTSAAAEARALFAQTTREEMDVIAGNWLRSHRLGLVWPAARFLRDIPDSRIGGPLVAAGMVGLLARDATNDVIAHNNRAGRNSTTSEFLRHIPQRALMEHFASNLMTTCNLNRDQVNELLAVLADNRQPPPNPPQRRHGTEQQLIDRFRNEQLTPGQRLSAAALLLIEARRNNANNNLPTRLGEGDRGINSQTVVDYITSQFRTAPINLRFAAAQAMVANENMSGQEYAAFCMSVANNPAAEISRHVRIQAISSVALTLSMAQQTEERLSRNGVPDSEREAYLFSSYQVTRDDLERCLQGLATNAAGDPDIRAYSAAMLHTVNRTPPEHILPALHTVIARWHANAEQPAGTFANATVAAWAQDLRLPLAVGPEQISNLERVFMATTALGLLGDQAFAPVLARNNVTPEILNNALISCVNAGHPEAAAQAVQFLSTRLATLTDAQRTALRTAIERLRTDFSLPPRTPVQTARLLGPDIIAYRNNVIANAETAQAIAQRRAYSIHIRHALTEAVASLEPSQRRAAIDQFIAELGRNNPPITVTYQEANNERPASLVFNLPGQQQPHLLELWTNLDELRSSVPENRRRLVELIPTFFRGATDQEISRTVTYLEGSLSRPPSPEQAASLLAQSITGYRANLNQNLQTPAAVSERQMYSRFIQNTLLQMISNVPPAERMAHINRFIAELGRRVPPVQVRYEAEAPNQPASLVIVNEGGADQRITLWTRLEGARWLNPFFDPHPEGRAAAATALGELLANRPASIDVLETALRFDPAARVRMAALEALARLRPASLRYGRTLQQVCHELIVTETDPAILARLRSIEFAERSAPDPNSTYYINEFQRARHDLLLSLNCRGDRSLAAAPAFILRHCVRELQVGNARLVPPLRLLQTEGPNSLQALATGPEPRATEALRAIAYLIIANGRPLDVMHNAVVLGRPGEFVPDLNNRVSSAATGDAVRVLCELSRTVNPNQNAQRARDILWALELGLVLQPNLGSGLRRDLLESYTSLVERMPADSALRERAGVVAAVVLQRSFVSEQGAPWSIGLQRACITALDRYRTRAALPVLELIRLANRQDDVRQPALNLLTALRTQFQIPESGPPLDLQIGRDTFDDVFFRLRAELRTNDTIANDPALRRLFGSFANRNWFFTNGFTQITADDLGFRPDVWNPSATFDRFLRTARQESSSAPAGEARDRELRVQREARLALAYIISTNGDGLLHSRRDEFVLRCAEALADITSRRCDGIEQLDLVIQSALAGQPLMSLDRRVRDHLVTALINRTEPRGGIQGPRAAAILASALEAEYQTMPRQGEPGFEASRDLQIRLLTLLATPPHRHRMCTPIVEALALNHPVPAVRARAQETLIALNDNVWRVWDAARQPAAIDQTTSAAARAQTLARILEGVGTHDGIVQAIFNAYLGRPIVADDPRHNVYTEAISDVRPHVRLAAAQVLLRSENTGFNQVERNAAMVVAADAALRGNHIGLRVSGRSILMDNLPVGRHTIRAAQGRTIEIVKTADNITIVEMLNGRVMGAHLNGESRTSPDTLTPAVIETLFRDRALSPEIRLAAARNWFATNHNDLAPNTYNQCLGLLIELANAPETRTAAITIMADALRTEQNFTQSLGEANRAQRQLLLVEALSRYTHPLAQQAIRTAALEHLHFHVSRAAGRIFASRSLESTSSALAGQLNDDTVVPLDPITSEGDPRRHWLVDNPATGLGRLAQLYTLIDRRSTAVSAAHKQLVIGALARLAIDGNQETNRQCNWMFRTLDPALVPGAILELNLRLNAELAAIQQGQAPNEQQSQRIARCLDLILAVSRSSPLTSEAMTRLQTTLGLGLNNHIADSPQLRQIVELLATYAIGPVLTNTDVRLDWLTSPHAALRFGAARDCLLNASTAVTAEQRERAIQVLSRLAIQGSTEMRTQAQNLLLALPTASINIALDELASLALEFRDGTQQGQLLSCWTFSEQLCQQAQLPRTSERLLRAQLERRRADGSADEQELLDRLIELVDSRSAASYDPAGFFSRNAVERYAVFRLAASETHGADSLEVARMEIALAAACFHRSTTHPDAATSREHGESALRVARHAYQVLALRLGPNSPETCQALYRLGVIEVSQGQVASGLGHLNEAFAIFTRNPNGIGPANGAWIASQLVQAYARNGDHQSAENISRQLLKVTSQRIPIEQAFETVRALNSLADSFSRSFRPPQHRSAESVLRRAFDVSRNGLGAAHPITLESMLNLAANLAIQQGNVQAATTLMDRAMTLFQQATDVPTAQQARIHRAHAHVLVNLGRLRESVEASQRSRDLSTVLAPR